MTALKRYRQHHAPELSSENWLRLQMASVFYRRRYPLTIAALKSAWRILREDPWYNQQRPSLMLTSAQVDEFFLQGMEYAETQLQLLVEITPFKPDDAGVRRLLRMQQRWEENDQSKSVSEGISLDPLYPIYQHIGQAFRNVITGRQPFVLKALSTLPSKPLRLCDIGCGSGILLGDILEHGFTICGLGIDVSHIVINHAQKVLLTRRLHDRAILIEGDACHLPVTSSSIDVVVAMEILEHLPDPVCGLGEMIRILRPGGHLVASVPIRCPLPGHLFIFDSVEDVFALLHQNELMLFTQEIRQIGPDVLDVLVHAQKLAE